MLNLALKHFVFDSLEEMLTHETLSELLSKPVTHVDIQPLNGHSGLAGGRLSYVNTNIGRLVLKQMSIHSDWVMFTSNDHLCRSVTLWQYGLLDQLNTHMEHKIIACSRDGEGWAILNHDLTEHCFAWNKPMAPGLVPAFLKVLAGIHSTFWNDPCLNVERLGLCDLVNIIDQTSPIKAQNHRGQDMGVLPDWIKGGWEVMEELLEPDVYMQMMRLIESPQPLVETLSHYPYTLLHGDYRAENLAYPGTPVIIDWQEASRSLMTIDLAWFVRKGYVRESLGQAQAVSYYRNQLETCLRQQFDDEDWQSMLDLGYLVDSLRATCFSAYWYKQHATANNIKDRDYLAYDVKTRGQQFRDALRLINIS
jgi:hypothetical protein